MEYKQVYRFVCNIMINQFHPVSTFPMDFPFVGHGNCQWPPHRSPTFPKSTPKDCGAVRHQLGSQGSGRLWSKEQLLKVVKSAETCLNIYIYIYKTYKIYIYIYICIYKILYIEMYAVYYIYIHPADQNAYIVPDPIFEWHEKHVFGHGQLEPAPPFWTSRRKMCFSYGHAPRSLEQRRRCVAMSCGDPAIYLHKSNRHSYLCQNIAPNLDQIQGISQSRPG